MFSATWRFMSWAPGISGQATSLGGGGGRFVMGRDCSNENLAVPSGSSHQAHSMSWGTPSKVRSTSMASAANADSCSSSSEERPRRSSAMVSIWTPWSPSGTTIRSLSPTTVSFAVRVSRSMTNVSGVTCPPTTASPKPKLALTINSCRSPVPGFAVNRMPETSAGTIAWTTTAMATAAWSMSIS